MPAASTRDRIVNEYRLDEDTHALILQDLVEVTKMGRCPTEAPLAVVLGGQPASGKSNLIKWCKDEYFADGNVCVVNGDEFRGAHPRSDEIHQKYESMYAEITDADVRTWTRDVLESCVQGGYNIIFEGTMRTDAVCKTVRRMCDLGYRVVAGVMAVPYHVSFMSIYLRYLNEVKCSGHGRQVSLESHDLAYVGMPKTVRKLVEQGYCKEFVVFERLSPSKGASFVTVTSDPSAAIDRARSFFPNRRVADSLRLAGDTLAKELESLGQPGVARSFRDRWEKVLSRRLGPNVSATR